MARIFRKRYGCSPGDYLRKLRIAAASEELANSDTPIIAIALQNGFSDQSHLTRTFRQYMGVSLAAFRKAQMGQATQSTDITTRV
jgi:AraC family transcriptional regulator